MVTLDAHARLPCPLCQELVPIALRPGQNTVRCPNCQRELIFSPDGPVLRVGRNLTSFDLQLEAGPSAAPVTRAPMSSTSIEVVDSRQAVVPSVAPAARVVVGIDFGTARSGYAYAFPQDGTIFIRTAWPDQPFPYAKTPTNLLLGPAGDVLAWGYTARKELARLKKDRAGRGCLFVREFKTQLQRGEPSAAGPVFLSSSGAPLAVVDLVAAYLGWLKRLALADLQAAFTDGLAERDVQWCLTVPAIWTDAEKHWMRRAAQKAGLIGADLADQARLCLVLEPEAAALHVLGQERTARPALSRLEPGMRFMVVDAGGGTVDVTVHEVGPDGDLEEVVAGGGGLHGSAGVDRGFERYLQQRLRPASLSAFQKREPLAHLRLMNDWESAKCDFEGTRGVLIPLPVELHRLLGRDHPAVLERLAAAQDGDDANLHLDAAAMTGLFQPALEGILASVRAHFLKLGATRCHYLFLVGGFAASPLLQETIRTEFGTQVDKVIVPPQPGVAVVSGAAAYGLDPARIRVRRSRLTYGCSCLALFDPGKDPESRKVWHKPSKSHRCKGGFKVFVRAGEALNVNKSVAWRFSLRDPSLREARMVFYASPQADVRYTDEPGVFEVGRLTLRLPGATGDARRNVEVSMFFGRTEVAVEARHLSQDVEARLSLRLDSTDLPEGPGG